MKVFKGIELSLLLLVQTIIVFTLLTDGIPYGILIVPLTGLLSMTYFMAGVFIFGKMPIGKNLKTIALGIPLGIITSIALMGIVFKFMLYEGANIMLGTGLYPALMGLIVVVVLFAKSKENRSHWKLVMFRLVVLIIPALLLYSKSEVEMVENRYSDYPFYIDAYKVYMDDPTKENVLLLDEAREKMDSLRISE